MTEYDKLVNALLFGSDKNKHKHSMRIKDAFKHYIALKSTQTYDRVDGIPNYLIDMEFDITLQEVGYKLSKYGKGYALVILKHRDMVVPTWGEVYDYRKVAGFLTRLELKTEDVIERDGNQYPVVVRFYFNDEDVVVKDKVIYIDDNYDYIQEPMKYMEDKIPAVMLRNNALGMPDLPKHLEGLLDEFEYYGEQLGVEWEKIKTQFLNNLLFGSTKDGEEWSKDMQSGKDVHDVSDDDGKLQSAISPLISGSTTPNIVLTNMQYIEDKILKYAMQYREVSTSGSNKHNLEIAAQNQQAYEYLQNKLEFRQRQLNKFVNIYNKVSGNTIELTIKLPELEEYKTRNMEASIANLEAQAANQQAQANNQNAQALAAAQPEVEGE